MTHNSVILMSKVSHNIPKQINNNYESPQQMQWVVEVV